MEVYKMIVSNLQTVNYINVNSNTYNVESCPGTKLYVDLIGTCNVCLNKSPIIITRVGNMANLGAGWFYLVHTHCGEKLMTTTNLYFMELTR